MIEQGETLSAALNILMGSRQESYGSPSLTYTKVADVYNLVRGKSITGEDVAWVMLFVKLVRERFKHSPDNMIDAAAYIDIINELKGLQLTGPSA